MITNEREYRITRRQLAKLRQAIREFDPAAVEERVGSAALASAEVQALKSEEEALSGQLREYEALRSGAIRKLEASSLAELPRMLIQARIAQRLSQRELAELTGLKEQQIQRYEADEYRSASLRRLREIAEALKLQITEVAEIAPATLAIQTPKSVELEWDKFPVREMYRRGWFEGFSGSLDAALQSVDTLVPDFVTKSIRRPTVALHRRRVRSGSSVDHYALLAWECRVLALAARAELGGSYRAQSLNSDWIAELRNMSSEPDGPLRARAMLHEAGIALIVEPHLPSTHLDGAAMLYGNVPVIGMTLRYDRLDNFWFVLLHELFHVMKHLRKGKLQSIFDDLDAGGEERIELEADTLAGESLIPGFAWNRALARYVRSVESVVTFASDLGINPALVAGRIRHEAKNYLILNELVGQGDVRKHFPEAGFGA